MWIEFVGDVLDVLGKVMIAMTALAVYDTLTRKQKVEATADKGIRREHIYAFLGITLIIAGFTLRHIGRYLA